MPDAAVHVGSGKVRELYALEDDHATRPRMTPDEASALADRWPTREAATYSGRRLLLVASDRISVFDVVLPTPVPDKGRVLTGLSAFWFVRTEELCPNHLLAVRPDGRSLECRRLEMLPLECVVRGYLAGSGWQSYCENGSVCGLPLPDGLVESEELPEPIFTPTTKALTGHDEPLTPEQAADLVGRSRLAEVEQISLALYRFAADYAAARGIIIADTKFEFGLDEEDRLVLADEALTPDSSRFWPADEYTPGRSQPSFDKQFVRDHCAALDWDKTPPGPELPDEVVAGTRSRYVEAFQLLTGHGFDAYLADPEVVLP